MKKIKIEFSFYNLEDYDDAISHLTDLANKRKYFIKDITPDVGNDICVIAFSTSRFTAKEAIKQLKIEEKDNPFLNLD